jgi:hypothetical protein
VFCDERTLSSALKVSHQFRRCAQEIIDDIEVDEDDFENYCRYRMVISIKKVLAKHNPRILYDQLFFSACDGNNLWVARSLYKKLQMIADISMSMAIGRACERGHEGIVNFLISKENWQKYADYADPPAKYVFSNACFGGNKRIIRKIMKCGATNWDDGLRGACHGKHYDVIEMLIGKGITNWNPGLEGACCSGDMKLVERIIKNGANCWYNGMNNACTYGHIEVVKLMIDKGAIDFEYGLNKSCRHGFREIAELLISCGANNFNYGLIWACYGKQLETTKLMIESHGEVTIAILDIALTHACVYKGAYVSNKELVEYLIGLGARTCRTCNNTTDHFTKNKITLNRLRGKYGY